MGACTSFTFNAVNAVKQPVLKSNGASFSSSLVNTLEILRNPLWAFIETSMSQKLRIAFTEKCGGSFAIVKIFTLPTFVPFCDILLLNTIPS